MSKHLVFVYGTLKKGEPNHSWFSKDPGGYFKFLCDAKTVLKYPLIIATKYNVPFLLHSPGSGCNVVGELYEVNDKVFEDLDVLEDHPKFYVREQDEVQCLATNETYLAWMYFIKNFRKDLLSSKMFECYSSEGPHGLKYVPRYLRQKDSNLRSEIFNNENFQ